MRIFTIRNLLLISLLFGLQNWLYSQSISGKVLDENQEPLIGVNIVDQTNLEIGTITDIDGSFSLNNLSPASTLLVSYIGYKDQLVKVGDETNFTIILLSDSEILDEVVVTALNIKRQKRELGYSTETFSGEELEKSSAPNVISALSGKAAGVQVSNGNGVDGGTTRITIRGNNNITGNNQPLIIVDGVPLENTPGLESIGRGQDWGSAINNINPADIATYNILKGPTAAAKYGARGSNGVIIITTKRGKIQKGLGVNYSVNYRTVEPYYYRDVQNKYGAGGPLSLSQPKLPVNDEGVEKYPSAINTDNGPGGQSTSASFGFYGSGVSWGPEMNGQMIEWWDGEMRAFSPQEDNVGLYFGNGNSTTHNLSFSGGNDMGTIRVSLSRLDNEAIIPNSNFNQSTVNLGANLRISPKLNADLSMSYINYHRLNTPTLGDENNSFGKGIIYSYPRSYKGIEADLFEREDGTRNNWGGSYPFQYIGSDLWWNTYHNNKTLDRNKMIGALTLTYDVNPWLNVMGRLGTDLTFQEFETKNDPIDFLGIEGGKYEKEVNRDIVRNNEFLITAFKDKLFSSPVGASISFGGTQWYRSQYGLKIGTGEWVNPWLFSLNNYEDANSLPALNDPNNLPEVRYDKKINSLFGFVNLNYSNFVFLELGGRNDWSSALPINSNDYFYPSASLSFILSEALDLKQAWINFLKLRSAYAQTASDTDPFLVDFVYETSSFGGDQTASLPNVVPPIGLKPQKANSYEFGLSAGLFNSKVNLDFTYYYISSFDQILDSPLPYSSGANQIRINTGELENKGFEALLNIKIIQKKDFYLESSLNFARNRNKVISLGDGAKILELDNIWGLNGPAIAVQEGQDFGTIIGYDHIYHENGEPILNEAGTHYEFTENRVPIGNASPDFTGGWTLRLGYKGFELNTLVDTKWGGEIYAGSYVIGLQTGQSPETLVERDGNGLPYTDPDGITRNVGVVLDGVYANGQENDKVVHYYYKYLPNAGGWGRWLSKPGIQENSWIKMREISLSYNFNDKLINKLNFIQSLRLSLVGRDLFYIYSSLPDRINPEGLNGSGNAQGLEWGAFPGVRSFGINVNASF